MKTGNKTPLPERRNRTAYALFIGLGVTSILLGSWAASRGLNGAVFGTLGALATLVFCLRSLRFTWVFYFISLAATGVVVEVGPVLIRPEIVALPVLLLGVFAGTARQGWRVTTGRGWLAVLSILYCLVGVFSSLAGSPQPNPSLWILLQIVGGLIALHVIWPLNELKLQATRIGTWVFALVSAYSIAMSFLGNGSEAVSGMSYGVASDGRLIGFAYETNLFASQSVGWLAVVAAHWKSLSRGSRALNVITLIAVLLAGTRAAWIALAFLVIVILIRALPRNRYAVVGALSFCAAALAAIPAVLSLSHEGTNSFGYRLTNLFSTDSGTGAYRVGLYETAFQDIVASGNWLFGTGINTFSQFHPVDPTGVGAAYLSSVWVATLYDVGVIGALVFFSLFLVVVIASKNRLAVFLVVAVLLICASATNLVWFQYPWVFIALASSSASRAVNKVKRHPSLLN